MVTNAAPGAERGAVQLLAGGRAEFRQAITSERIVAVKFYAPWCRACRAMKRKFERMAQDYAERGLPVQCFEVNAGDETSRQLAMDLEIKSLPSVAVYIDGGGPHHSLPCPVAKLPQLLETMEEVVSALPEESVSEAANAAPKTKQGAGTREDDFEAWDRFRMVLASTRAFLNSPWNARLHTPEQRDAIVGKLSKGQIREFRAAFDTLDLDGSGTIGLDELSAALRMVGVDLGGGGAENAQKLAETMDSADPTISGNKVLDFPKFLTLMACDAAYDNTVQPLRAASKQMIDVFERFEDTPGSGFVTADRIRDGLESLDPPLHLSERAAAALLREYDVDGDGLINYRELVRMLMMDC